jgi:RNA polymerase sigma-70 factor (ECF subfamily)
MTVETPEGRDWLAQRFEQHRTHLRAVAYRLLGSLSEAEDAVQEGWLRLSRADTGAVENLGGWLTTVVARVCLDMLRTRAARREEQLEALAAGGVRGAPDADDTSGAYDALGTRGASVPDPVVDRADALDPEHEVLLADSVGLALLVVLETLAPAERLAFVLHDVFAVSFEEIAPIVGRSPAAARQLASRARRRVRGASAEPDVDLTRQREVVEAFLAASRGGDFEALLEVLDPDVVLRLDRGAVPAGAPRASGVLHGAAAVAGLGLPFSGDGWSPHQALVNGAAGVIMARRGRPAAVIGFTVRGGKIAAIDILADPTRIRRLELPELA